MARGGPGAVSQGAALALVVGLAAMSTARAADGELPNCTFEACPVCLPDAKTSLSNLTIFGPDGRYHQVPLRLAKAPAFWDTQSFPAQVAGFLIVEQLGIAVDYVAVRDETMSWLGINNCIGFSSYSCATWEVHGDQALRDKVFKDVLADVFFAPSLSNSLVDRSTTQGTDLDFEARPSVSLGPTGFSTTSGLFVRKDIVSRAAADSVELRWFPSLEADKVKKYFDTPQRLINDGIVAEVRGCSSNKSIVQSGMNQLLGMGYQCRDSWWITPTCAKFGDQWTTKCMVMVDDNWGYWKPEVYASLAQNKVPMAKLTVGYDVWFRLANSGMYNTTLSWWLPDATLANLAPEYMRMHWDAEPEPAMQVKGAYGPALEADPKLKAFLTALDVDSSVLTDLMRRATAAYISGHRGDAAHRKVACDWLRANAELWKAWIPSPRDCVGVAGQGFDDESQHCVTCKPGTYAPAREAVCLSCPVGTFTQVEGALECASCIPGQFSSVTGASTGEVCQRCPQGTFAAHFGRSACEACNKTLTTWFAGADAQSDCTCEVGSYLRLPADGKDGEARCGRCRVLAPGQASCTSCVKGLLCPGGDERPLQAVGFAVSAFTVGGPTTIVACSSTLKCPGGTPLGTCPDHHEGIACDVCSAGYFDQQGQCTSCEGRNPAITIVPVLVSTLVGIFLLVRAGRRGGVGATSAITVMLTCSLTVSTLQTISSFEKLLRNWPEPLASIYTGLRFFTIDVNVIGLTCLLPYGQPEAAYFGSLLLHPSFAVALVLGACFLRLIGRRILLDEVINIQGLVVSSIYIALTIVSLRPWQCNENPDGTSSVASSPSVICWSSSQHGLMITSSLVALSVYVVGAFALVVWATAVYPRKLHSSEGERFIRRFRFLYFRFNAQHYRYVILVMIRSVLVSILPVVLINEPAMCLMLLLLVVGAGVAVLSWVRPWRELWINYMDAIASMAMLLILAGAAMVTDVTSHTEQMVKLFYMFLIIVVGGCLLGVGLFSLWRWIIPPVPFGVFLCHHKDGAAVLSRWFKMLLNELTSDRIFLDADELDRLDKIFQIVAHETKYVVLILTEHTMERIWCAGEMATAVRYNVGTLVVACNDYTPPSDDFIANIAGLWSQEQQNQAFALGVCIQDIQDGYYAIRDMPFFTLDRESHQVLQERMAHRLFEHCPKLHGTPAGQMHRLRRTMRREQAEVVTWSPDSPTSAKGAGHGYIVVAGDMEDPEAATACAVIARLLARDMAAVVRVLQHGETSPAQHPGTRFILTALSRNVLRNAAFAATLVEAEQHALTTVPVITDTHFRIPGAAFWQARGDRSTDEWPDGKLLSEHKTSFDDVASCYRRLFNVLAMRFSTIGSSRIQAAEIKELVQRLSRGESGKSHPGVAPPEALRTTPLALPQPEMPPADGDEPEPRDFFVEGDLDNVDMDCEGSVDVCDSTGLFHRNV